MKLSRKVLAMILAISFVFSSACLCVFADDAIESPIIPVGPQSSEWYVYDYNVTEKTAVLVAFNEAAGRYNATVRSSVQKDGETYAVVGVGPEAFKGTAIRSVVISEGVTSIAAGAFANCASLTSVEFANSLTFVDETAFDGSAWLNAQPDGIIYAGKIAYKAKGACPASVTLEADTVAIADGAFRGQTTLEKIIIPAETEIGTEAFAGCTAVTLYCYENSHAHLYAQTNSINFVLIPSLALVSAPTKLEYYQNDALNFAGIQLVYFSEAGETEVAVTDQMVSGYDAAVLGTQTVTITYEGKTVTFQVNVIERPAFVPGDVDGSGSVEIDDAIYLLFHINFAETYPVNQPVDFDGNGEEEIDDAIYLLFHVNFSEQYPLH